MVMKEHSIKKENVKKYLNILSSIGIFSGLSLRHIKKLLDKMTQVYLPGREVLIQKGSTDSATYILIYGRLRVADNTEECDLADISPGEIVGEISLLTNKARTATVFAVRDCVLLKLSKKEYDDFAVSHPDVAYQIAKIALERLIIKTKPTYAGEKLRAIAIAPSAGSNHLEFAEKIYNRISKHYSCCMVDSNFCNRRFHSDIAQSNEESEFNQAIVKWMQSLEDEYDIVILITDRQYNPWTARCIRESDHVFFIAESWKYPTLNAIETEYFNSECNKFQTADLIIIHPDNVRKITGTKKWLIDRDFTRFHHIHRNSSTHMDKIVRILFGNAIGVVLNGGGAKAFAHLGVLRAFNDKNVPVDFIAGASMGAVIGSSVALKGVEFTKKFAWDFAQGYRNDYTFPFISLLKGEVLFDFMKLLYNDAKMEDMWINFVCVSTNLTSGKMQIDSEGEIWRAVRKSLSLPGVYPPIYQGSDMIIDGGVYNNMPVNVLRETMKGGKIIAVNCCKENTMHVSKTYDTPTISGWKVLAETLLHRGGGRTGYSNIFDVIQSAVNFAARSLQDQMSKEADFLIEVDTNQFGLLEFLKVNEIEEIGYKTAIEYLSDCNITS